jgi:hypothetical protein
MNIAARSFARPSNGRLCPSQNVRTSDLALCLC